MSDEYNQETINATVRVIVDTFSQEGAPKLGDPNVQLGILLVGARLSALTTDHVHDPVRREASIRATKEVIETIMRHAFDSMEADPDEYDGEDNIK